MLVERRVPSFCYFAKQWGEIVERFGVEGYTAEVDHSCGGRRSQWVGERAGAEPEHVDIVKERGGRAREAHAAEFGDHIVGCAKPLRAQSAPEPT